MTNFVRGALVCLLFAFPMSANAQHNHQSFINDLLNKLNNFPACNLNDPCEAARCHSLLATYKYGIIHQTIAAVQHRVNEIPLDPSVDAACTQVIQDIADDLPCPDTTDPTVSVAGCGIINANEINLTLENADESVNEANRRLAQCTTPQVDGMDRVQFIAVLRYQAQFSKTMRNVLSEMVKHGTMFPTPIAHNTTIKAPPTHGGYPTHSSCRFDILSPIGNRLDVAVDFGNILMPPIATESQSLVDLFFRILAAIQAAADLMSDTSDYAPLVGDCNKGFPQQDALCNKIYADYRYYTGQTSQAPPKWTTNPTTELPGAYTYIQSRDVSVHILQGLPGICSILGGGAGNPD